MIHIADKRRTQSVGSIVLTSLGSRSYTYDAFGNETEDNATDGNPFRYCGEYYDTESGLIYLRNRYYDPSVGRFISEDPYWNPDNMIYGDNASNSNVPDYSAIRQSANLYVYCMSNPVMLIDPLGLYDRWAAVDFAMEYSVNTWLYDEDYVRFNQDCTGFVSNCLRAGGVRQSDDWYVGLIIGGWLPMKGYVVKGSYSKSWAVSDDQYEIFSNRSKQYTNRYSDGEHICIHESRWIANAIHEYNIRPGDLLYFLDPKTNKMGHTAIIVSTENGRIKYAQHDDNKNDGDLGRYLDEHTSQMDYNYVFVVKIRDDA